MSKTRRRWSDAEKRAIVKECTRPGAVVACIARERGATTSQIYNWRKRFAPPEPDIDAAEPVFLPVAIEGRDQAASVDADAGVTIRFVDGHEMEFAVLASEAAISRLLQVVAAL